MNILFIEDDIAIADYILKGLNQAGYICDHAGNGRDGLAMALDNKYSVLIMDRMLPQLDGLSVVKALRAAGNKVPILFLSALSDVDERVEGLKAGGDDYLTKPFSFSELEARIEALIRRREPTETIESPLQIADMTLDILTRTVVRAGEKIPLLSKEFALLHTLMKARGRILTRTMLLEAVWGYNFDTHTNVIDVHISNLRRKIDDGHSIQIIQTVRGSGYKIETNV